MPESLANHSVSRHSVTSRITQGELEAQNRQRYIARRTMARRPSRVQPIIIVLLVMSIGIFLIGIIMTIIGNWPGYSGIGGNSLEVAGPILISIGGIIFIIGMVAICYRNHTSKERWEKAISERTMSRSRSTLGNISNMSHTTLGASGQHSTASSHQPSHQPHHNHHVSQDPMGRSSHTPSVNAPAGKSILKKSSSASSTGYDQDSGAPANHNYSRDSDSSLGSAAQRYNPYRVEQLPDPIGSRRTDAGSHAGPIEQSSDTEGGLIPEPVRASRRTPRSTRAQHDNSQPRQNHGAPPPRVTPLQSDTSAGNANSAYQSDDQNTYAPPQPQPRSADPRPVEPMNPVIRAPMQRPFRPPVRPGMAIRPGMPVRPMMPRQPMMRVPRPMHPGIPGQQMVRAPLAAGQRPPFRPIGGPMLRQSRPVYNDATRINIHAQPGTNVHITPDRNFSQDSNETSI